MATGAQCGYGAEDYTIRDEPDVSRSEAEEELREQFGQYYSQSHLSVNQRIEQAVCGCDYGGVSWATRAEIDEVGEMLALQRGHQLMDLGAGSGWPGIYMSAASGCDVTLVDLPAEGLAVAMTRARKEALKGACHVAVADGQALPFASGSFDAITHSDVLCCLPPKRAVLDECRRTISEDGSMIFSVISVTPGLCEEDRLYTIEIGPPFIEAETGYDEMLALTGWKVTHKIDKTEEFLDSARIFRQADLDNRTDLEELIGEEELAGRLDRDAALVDVIARGHMLRELFRVRPV